MRVILTTVGTSLLSNMKRGGIPSSTAKQRADYLRNTDAKDAAAETNSLHRLIVKDDRVVLLHSATEEGRICAASLRDWVDWQKAGARTHEIKHLSYETKAFKLRGLAALASVLAHEIRNARLAGFEPIISATGGFKAEAAICAQVGQVLGVGVFYIHEAFQEIIELPPAPIGWDYSIIAEYESFFTWISADLRTAQDVDLRWPALPPKVAQLLVDEDGYRLLSPLGQAYYEGFHEALDIHCSARVLFSANALKWYYDADPTTQQSFAGVIARLKVPEIRINSSHRVDNCDCLVFPSGRYPDRLFYAVDDDDTIRVMELTRHDSRYDTLIKKGINRASYVTQDFQTLG